MTKESKGIEILTDEYELNPILDFTKYKDTVTNIIIGTTPRFSIGIYGEWGYGKTTLMRLIEDDLKNKEEILTVWFNAWGYERENQFAIIALMKTIAFAMEKHKIYSEIKPIILRSIKIVTKGLISKTASRFIGEKGIDEFFNKFLSKMDLLNEIDKETIYFDGINKIETGIKEIIHKYSDSRIVVFIDDLDRCSPNKALEVFESIKVFLDIQGFVFVIGLSHETISKLISIEYKESEIKGDQYIKKIIQIPIIIPEWNKKDIENLIENISETGKLKEIYLNILRDNKGLIAKAVELNPRELKRFINSYIISHELYSSNLEIKPRELLIVQSLKIRWNRFYQYFSKNNEFRDAVRLLTNIDSKQRMAVLTPDIMENMITKLEKTLASRKNEEKKGTYRAELDHDNIEVLSKQLKDQRKLRQDMDESLNAYSEDIIERLKEIDIDLWTIIESEKDIIFNITNWETYRRAIESFKDIPLSGKMVENSYFYKSSSSEGEFSSDIKE